MRLWMVDPKKMCRAHLLGEHYECHKLVGAINKGRSIKGYLDGLVDTRLIAPRHDDLASEMVRRGGNHNSPINYSDQIRRGYVRSSSESELLSRCKECRRRSSNG